VLNRLELTGGSTPSPLDQLAVALLTGGVVDSELEEGHGVKIYVGLMAHYSMSITGAPPRSSLLESECHGDQSGGAHAPLAGQTCAVIGVRPCFVRTPACVRLMSVNKSTGSR
jgi:hypothetical protein